MVAVADILKKSEARRSKKTGKFQAIQRRAWDYVSVEDQTIKNENKEDAIWERKEEQSGNGIENNWKQSGNVTGNNWVRNEEHNVDEKGNQIRNNNAIQYQADQRIPHNTYLTDEEAQKRMLTLTGHQENILRLITSHIKVRVGNPPYIIEIFRKILAKKIHATIDVTKESLKRLVEKNILVRMTGNRGRNGCSKFMVNNNIVKLCFNLFNDPPCDINLIGNEIRNLDENKFSYSSSIKINTTTALPDNWEQIDTSSLSDIGFSRTQLSQLVDKNTPEVVEESINHFAFALKNNPTVKAYPNPLNVVMGVLLKGRVWFEKNYVSPKEESLKKVLEFKKQEAERISSLEKSLIEEEYKIWIRDLTEEEKEKILMNAPKTNLLSKGLTDKSNEGYLLSFFKEKKFKK